MMQHDPRTVARDIPGIVDELFPQLTPGTISHINSKIESFPITRVSDSLLARSKTQRAMLFELAYAVAEVLLSGTTEIDWDECFSRALQRQRNFFDAKLPEHLEAVDKEIAHIVGKNLSSILRKLTLEQRASLTARPSIPGMEWISNGIGDFSIDSCLIEVKCTANRFSSADYRQVAIYWLLSYVASIEGRGEEWKSFILLNPRRGELTRMRFDTLIGITSGYRTKVEILQSFQSLIGSRNMKS